MPFGSAPRVGVTLSVETPFLEAVEPLLDSGEIEAVEWRVDGTEALPLWAGDLLNHFSTIEGLYGRTAALPLLAGQWGASGQAFLASAVERRRPYRLLSVALAPDPDESLPLPAPLDEAAFRRVSKRLSAVQSAFGVPIALENRGFLYAAEDVAAEPLFLGGLAAELDGFLDLDLNNLHCHEENFNLPPGEVVRGFPLDRVRVARLSGGSWFSSEALGGGSVRLPTHDGRVAEAVLDLLRFVIRRCPKLEAVLFHRGPGTLMRLRDRHNFQEDFREVRRVVAEECHVRR